MHDDENGNDDLLQDMSESDMLAELIDRISQPGISDDKLRKILDKILDYVEQVL
ncbi:MAG TPA: hypothetical protein VFM05_02805 [Candidatus Saccharimonadales bacterium]|nr:hypothetical protein [Candidatus Saccharimonadales bacterium]